MKVLYHTTEKCDLWWYSPIECVTIWVKSSLVVVFCGNGTRCRGGVEVLWDHSHAVWLVLEGSLPIYAFLCSENFFVTCDDILPCIDCVTIRVKSSLVVMFLVCTAWDGHGRVLQEPSMEIMTSISILTSGTIQVSCWQFVKELKDCGSLIQLMGLTHSSAIASACTS